ncbi:MAG: thioredoxin [Tannerellaceae bacterium]|jgi:thioredoxin|nr:thioredoxin [Tannerellaceae bacterium]
MKKIRCILAIVGVIFASCNAQTTANRQGVETVETEKAVKTIHLTKTAFLAKVANYEASPEEWDYLGDKPALIDFYADWCGPCKAIAPVLEELADEYDGQIYIYKIDTDAEQELAAVFGISSIPSLLFVPMGENPRMTQGALPKPQLKDAIEQLLLKK